MHTMTIQGLTDLLGEHHITPTDAVRLVLEALEALPPTTGRKSPHRCELLMQLRRLIYLGSQALRTEQATVSFAHAAAHSIESRSHRRPTTRRDLRHFVQRMLRGNPGLAMRPLRSISTQECRRILEQSFDRSPHSYRKGRAILHSIFAHGERQGWCGSNPVARIQAPMPKEKNIPPLTLAQIRRLEATAQRPEHRCMRFSLVLMLYCGVRPAEISRIEPGRDILWSERQVLIRPTTSKTGGGRIIPLRHVHPLPRTDCIIPKNWSERWRRLRRAAGFTHWQPDALRHTFASYHAAYYRNIHELQLEMGHRNAHLLYTRYVSPTSRKDATAFFEKMTC